MKRHMLTCESAVKGQVQVVQTGDKYSIEEKFKQFKPILPKPAPDTVMVQHQPPKISPMHLNPPVVMNLCPSMILLLQNNIPFFSTVVFTTNSFLINLVTSLLPFLYQYCRAKDISSSVMHTPTFEIC